MQHKREFNVYYYRHSSFLTMLFIVAVGGGHLPLNYALKLQSV